jgi:hypothetical protein
MQLPDGRVLWSFGDTFYGTVDSGRIRDGNKNVMVRNSFLIQEKSFSNQFSSLNPGYMKDTKTLITYKGSEESEHWYWPLDATIHENQLQMLLMHMVKTGDGMWGFAAASVDIALFSLPELKLTEIVHDKYSGDISYGSAVFDGDDGYTYLYGSSRTGMVTNLHAARAPDGDLTREWEFWNGTGWQNDHSEYAIHHNVSSMYSIWKESQKYYLFTQESNLGRKLFLYESDSPLGPFTNEKLLYEVPEEHGSGSMFSYNAIVHPELSKPGELLISYNKNPHNFWDNFTKPGSADLYIPVFIRIRPE